MKYNKLKLTAALIIAMTAPVLAQADTLEPVDKFYFSAGAYHASNDVKLRWDPKTGSVPGTNINAERDLGLDLDGTEGFFEVGGSFRRDGSSHRHKFEAFHYGYDANSSMKLDGNFQIGDDVFIDGADFEGDLEVKLLGASYTWFFHNTDDTAFGVGLGAVRYDVSAKLGAAAIVNGNIQAVSASVSEANWVPQIHAEYVKSLSEHWRVGADASYIRKSGGAFSGDAVDLSAKVDYFPWQHFGFSLRYNYNDISLKFNKSHFAGDVDVKTRGPQLIATLRF